MAEAGACARWCKLKHYGVGAAHMNSPGTVLSNRDKARSLPYGTCIPAREVVSV